MKYFSKLQTFQYLVVGSNPYYFHFVTTNYQATENELREEN